MIIWIRGGFQFWGNLNFWRHFFGDHCGPKLARKSQEIDLPCFPNLPGTQKIKNSSSTFTHKKNLIYRFFSLTWICWDFKFFDWRQFAVNYMEILFFSTILLLNIVFVLWGWLMAVLYIFGIFMEFCFVLCRGIFFKVHWIFFWNWLPRNFEGIPEIERNGLRLCMDFVEAVTALTALSIIQILWYGFEKIADCNKDHIFGINEIWITYREKNRV
jgi:hypothetical protein